VLSSPAAVEEGDGGAQQRCSNSNSNSNRSQSPLFIRLLLLLLLLLMLLLLLLLLPPVNQELCECGFGVAGLRLGFARGVGVVVFEHCSRHISVAHACTLHK
jgi:hypothetical protein